MTSLEAAMMGRQTGDQASLFYEFRLADRIPKDHLLRRINVVVGPVLDGVRGQLKPYYSQIGRPSIDPELMIRMLIVGYCSPAAIALNAHYEADGAIVYKHACALGCEGIVSKRLGSTYRSRAKAGSKSPIHRATPAPSAAGCLGLAVRGTRTRRSSSTSCPSPPLG
jgi:hypothetical protein